MSIKFAPATYKTAVGAGLWSAISGWLWTRASQFLDLEPSSNMGSVVIVLVGIVMLAPTVPWVAGSGHQRRSEGLLVKTLLRALVWFCTIVAAYAAISAAKSL